MPCHRPPRQKLLRSERRSTRPIARHTPVVSNSKHRIKARVDDPSADFHPDHGRSGWLKELAPAAGAAHTPLHRPPPLEVAQRSDKNNRPRGLFATEAARCRVSA